MHSGGKIAGMAPGPGLDAREATAALREATAGRLREGFARLVEAETRAGGGDWRDAAVSLVPFIDCARRLGLDPATALRRVVATAPREVRDAFDALAARPELSLADFGWAISQTAEGPAYRFAWPDGGAATR